MKKLVMLPSIFGNPNNKRNEMNKIIIGLLVLSLSANAYLLFKPKEVTVKASEPETVVVAETEKITITDDEYRRKYEQISKKLATTEAELNRISAELDVFVEREALKKIEQDLMKGAEEKVTSGKFEITEEFAKKQDEKRKAIVALFKKESIEASWAFQTQDNIKQAIMEFGDVDAYEVGDLVCKTSVCKLKINLYKQGLAARNMAMMNATMAITMGGNVQGLQMSGGEHLTENEQNSVLIYLSKKDD